MKQKQYGEEQIGFASGIRHAVSQGLPKDGRHRGDVLSLDEEYAGTRSGGEDVLLRERHTFNRGDVPQAFLIMGRRTKAPARNVIPKSAYLKTKQKQHTKAKQHSALIFSLLSPAGRQ